MRFSFDTKARRDQRARKDRINGAITGLTRCRDDACQQFPISLKQHPDSGFQKNLILSELKTAGSEPFETDSVPCRQ